MNSSGDKWSLIIINGIVQGVGFRPFIYRLAKQNNLRGYIKNVGDGTVEIVINDDGHQFVEKIKKNLPPLARIFSIDIKHDIPHQNITDFKIIKSENINRKKFSVIPPDVATCDDCLKELFDKNDRRYHYPFINCTNCGPRFTIAKALPYDRENTTISKFPMCEECKTEYEDVMNRRYFAQPTCCPTCGPKYYFIDARTRLKITDEETALDLAKKKLSSRKIIAIKGFGGFHAACVPESRVVKKLRELLNRPQQPFAIMARNLNAIKRIARVSKDDEKILKSYVRPIMILKLKEDQHELCEDVMPGLDTVGIMLPYAPIHYMLFENADYDFLVMTSANMPGEPMFINDSILDNLSFLEGILSHDLTIQNRNDDSVIKKVAGEYMLIRRSRGYTPQPFDIKINSLFNGYASGAELYNSLTIIKSGYLVQSQYIGNTTKILTLEYHQQMIDFFKKFFKIKSWDIVISDLHPKYYTSELARNIARTLGIPNYRIQHHFAHGLSVMAEKSLKQAISISVDGVGYGMNGAPWGGEILLIDFENNLFKRLAHLEEQPMPGGDLSAVYPARMALSILSRAGHDISRLVEGKLGPNATPDLVITQMKRGINTPKTTSCGRIFDIIGFLLGVGWQNTYEGEIPMKLEKLLVTEKDWFELPTRVEKEEAIYDLPYTLSSEPIIKGTRDEVQIINTTYLIEKIHKATIKNTMKKEVIASGAITTLARSFARIAIDAAQKHGIRNIVMSGGCAYNSLFTPIIKKEVARNDLKFYLNTWTGAGDNGISLGQAYLAAFLE